jgi:hypothetical protein
VRKHRWRQPAQLSRSSHIKVDLNDCTRAIAAVECLVGARSRTSPASCGITLPAVCLPRLTWLPQPRHAAYPVAWLSALSHSWSVAAENGAL